MARHPRGLLLASLWAVLVQTCVASVCPDGAPEAPHACINALRDCVSGRAADPCVCLDGFYPVGKQGWAPSGRRGYEFACCPRAQGAQGAQGGGACGEEQFAVILSLSLLSVGLLGFAICNILITSRRRLEVATPEDLALAENPVVQDGLKLHRTVEKDMWCITLDDLKQFRRLVGHAIAKGVIQPTDQDPFDIADTCIGPSMYTVTTQYIKPVTAAAGSPSWALMKHPEGLKCDLFITHGWAEGIFEFVDQVVNSWPFGAKAAYVCFLSNPQNLDISEMLKSPERSPFAVALHSATQVLAAPNLRESIYTRAWCVFEAYLAMTWDKAIYMATPPPPQFWARSLRACSWSMLMLGTCFSMVMVGNREWRVVREGPMVWLTLAFAVLTILSASTCALLMWRQKYEWKVTQVALFASSAFLAAVLAASTFQTSFQRPPNFVPFLMAPIIAWAMECDRLLGIEAVKQAKQLRDGFTGRIRDAKTSNLADGKRIREIIAENRAEADVDKAVAVLLRMNLSTSELRRATARVGALGNATSWSRAIFAINMSFWITAAFNTSIWRIEPGFQWVPFAATAEALIVGIGFQLLPRDRRAFAQSSGSLLLLFIPKFIPGVPAGGKWGDVILHGVAVPLLIMMAFAGPSRTARVPVLGPMLVRLLFGQHPCRFQRLEAAEDGSDSLQLQGLESGAAHPRGSGDDTRFADPTESWAGMSAGIAAYMRRPRPAADGAEIAQLSSWSVTAAAAATEWREPEEDDFVSI